jgi:hypothetical protein
VDSERRPILSLSPDMFVSGRWLRPKIPLARISALGIYLESFEDHKETFDLFARTPGVYRLPTRWRAHTIEIQGQQRTLPVHTCHKGGNNHEIPDLLPSGPFNGGPSLREA